MFTNTVSVCFRLRIRFSVWLVSGYAHGFALVCVVSERHYGWSGAVPSCTFGRAWLATPDNTITSTRLDRKQTSLGPIRSLMLRLPNKYVGITER